MFECNKCENEETELCNSCIEMYKPSNWKHKRNDIRDIITERSEIDVRKCKE
jgi:hypothetical protein